MVSILNISNTLFRVFCNAFQASVPSWPASYALSASPPPPPPPPPRFKHLVKYGKVSEYPNIFYREFTVTLTQQE